MQSATCKIRERGSEWFVGYNDGGMGNTKSRGGGTEHFVRSDQNGKTGWKLQKYKVGMGFTKSAQLNNTNFVSFDEEKFSPRYRRNAPFVV